MLEYKKIKGKILCKSGLHIHGSETGIKIGGIDPSLTIIRDPITELPFIPGSSLKGKMRYLLEHDKGVADLNGGKVPEYKKNVNELIPTVFGHTNHKEFEDEYKNQNVKNVGIFSYPTRVIFRDANVIGAYEDYTSEKPVKFTKIDKVIIKMNSKFSEAKTECVINRLTGTALGGGLRTIERVPAGTVFEFKIVLRIFKEEDEKYIGIIKQGLKLVENDALGGFGSRGSGRIKFFNLKLDGEDFNLNNVQL